MAYRGGWAKHRTTSPTSASFLFLEPEALQRIRILLLIIFVTITVIILLVSMVSPLTVLCAKFRHVQFQPQARPAAARIIGGDRIAMEKVLRKRHQGVGLREHSKV